MSLEYFFIAPIICMKLLNSLFFLHENCYRLVLILNEVRFHSYRDRQNHLRNWQQILTCDINLRYGRVQQTSHASELLRNLNLWFKTFLKFYYLIFLLCSLTWNTIKYYIAYLLSYFFGNRTNKLLRIIFMASFTCFLYLQLSMNLLCAFCHFLCKILILSFACSKSLLFLQQLLF